MPECEVNYLSDYVHDQGFNPASREIYIAGGEYDEINNVIATRFIKNLHLLEQASDKPILIHSITPGGEVCYGLAIYDAIITSNCYITILVHGLASSMSSVFLQGADLRILCPNIHVFLHDVEISSEEGSINTVRSDYNQWLRESDIIYNIYTERCQNGSYFLERNYKKARIKGFLKRKLAAGLYLMPSEAIEYGLADNILGGEKYKTVKDLLK